MRTHFVCDNFGPFVRGVPFEYGAQTTLFGHNHAFHWQGPQGHRYHRHGYQHHGHGHGPHGSRLHCHGLQSNRSHNQGAPCNRFHGHGHHGHGPHKTKLVPHSHGCYTNGDLFHKRHSFWPPHHLNQTCKPHHFWENITYSKKAHQYRRGRCEEEKQGPKRGHHAYLHNVTPRPHSV